MRRAKKGAGPPGLTAESARLMLDSEAGRLVAGLCRGPLAWSLCKSRLAVSGALSSVTSSGGWSFGPWLRNTPGADSLVHALASAVELDPEATVLSVDGVGAFDNVSRRAMLDALRAVTGANRCLPFVRLFYASASEFVWHDS